MLAQIIEDSEEAWRVMDESFSKRIALRHQLECDILELIRKHETITGWRITKIEYNWEIGRVISEAVPAS
jgi:hypothetical protein